MPRDTTGERVFVLIYASSATKLFAKKDLAALLERSRAKNARLWVSGMLLYKDGNFMQVLEGEEVMVRALYARIEADPRHKGSITLWQGEEERSFPDWTMGFRDVSADAPDIPGYSDFLNVSLVSNDFKVEPSRAKKLLRIFRSKM